MSFIRLKRSLGVYRLELCEEAPDGIYVEQVHREEFTTLDEAETFARQMESPHQWSAPYLPEENDDGIVKCRHCGHESEDGSGVCASCYQRSYL